MEIFCTYCSKDKIETAGDIPAINRYKSNRISSVSASAKQLGLLFYILSGEFGLIPSTKPIPYYAHLLAYDEIESMSLIIQQQILNDGIRKIIFFSISILEDKNLYPYHAALSSACDLTHTDLTIVHIGTPD